MTTLTVTWPLATTRVNGAALPSAQIASTKMYMAVNSGGFSLYQTRAPGDTQNAVITSVAPGTYKFQFETTDTDGQVGPRSTPVEFVVGVLLPALPSPPDVAGVSIVSS